MSFTKDYPERPPSVRFHPIKGEPLYHPNIYLDGMVCLSIINPPESRHGYGKGGTCAKSARRRHLPQSLPQRPTDSDCIVTLTRGGSRSAPPRLCFAGKPNLTILQVVLALQLFLDEATGLAAGRGDVYKNYQTNRAEYNRRVKLQVAQADHLT
jgi:ubiquitin-protein ligase